MDAFKAGVREFLQPPSFFEALGVRYVGPFDGHNVEEMEHAFHNAIELSAEGPILVHVLTQKGRGYSPAEDDDEKHLHDAPVFDPLVGPPKAVSTGYTQAFAEAILKEAESDDRIVAGPLRRCRVRPGSSRSRNVSRTGSSTSGSPNNTL